MRFIMGEKDLTVIGHLEELRKRIIIGLVAVAVLSMCAFGFSRDLLRILRLPAHDLIDKLAFFSPQEAFMVYLKIAVVSGFVLSLPILLYQLWSFISPAVEKRMRRYSVSFVLFSLLAFVLGCCFAYYVLVPVALNFLLTFSRGELEPVISVNKYISFVIAIILCAGLVFEMPVLSFLLSRIGILNHRFLRRRFKYAVLIICIIAAIITPTADIFNMLLLAVPMLCLYEISIWISFFVGPRARKLK